ncbi:hypothetical protein ACIQXM_02885 [Arthrobacter sp. NPDC097144]|uniref:hypothetical protein n=1 Tax=Arthrobacter sp. NPDC097144 TaxID=3363946 RepID=UPI00380AA554
MRGGIPLVLMSGIAVVLYAQGQAEAGRSTLCAALIFGVLVPRVQARSAARSRVSS